MALRFACKCCAIANLPTEHQRFIEIFVLASGSLKEMAEQKLDEAIELWERIDENATGPNSATGHLAAIYSEREQFEKATKLYEKLIKWHPETEQFRRGLKQAQAGLASKR